MTRVSRAAALSVWVRASESTVVLVDDVETRMVVERASREVDSRSIADARWGIEPEERAVRITACRSMLLAAAALEMVRTRMTLTEKV